MKPVVLQRFSRVVGARKPLWEKGFRGVAVRSGGDGRRRCVEVTDGVACGRQFRPPVRDPKQDRCAEHRSAVVLEVPRVPVGDGAMVSAVRADLERCGAVGSLAGAIALRLALTLDDPGLGASSVSSISAQLVKTMKPLQDAAPREPDRLDDLSARLAAKLGTA